MRDLVITLVVAAGVLAALRRPHIGIYVWSWLSYMNPHRLAWGFAYSMPFVQAAAGATLLGMLVSGRRIALPRAGLLWIWGAFVLWQCVSTAAAFDPATSWEELTRSLKIQLMILSTLLVISNRTQLHTLVWVMALSIGFFGIKGGVFTIATGGSYRVWGPPESFIAGNNEIALATIVVLPLMRYLQLEAGSPWVRRALGVAMLLCLASVLASYSRGAFLAAAAMGLFLVLKSPQRARMILVLALAVPLALAMMPERWFERMGTIESYEEDASAMGRINAWYFAWNLARDHPLTGGGFQVFQPDYFYIYAPEPTNYHDAHSIYFEVLGEQGFVGLFLFLALWAMAWRLASRTIRATAGRREHQWAARLASMCQVSLVGYGVGGAFLGLAYWDLPYQVMAVIVLTHEFVRHRAGVPDHARAGHRPMDRRDETPGPAGRGG